MRPYFLLSILVLLPIAPLRARETKESLEKQAGQCLARIEGEVSIPGLKDRVEVLRDRWGIPHIYAKNQEDLFFAQGFIAAQDRLFQMDMWRRLSVGETAEVQGKAGVETDRLARLLKYRGKMEDEWASYSPDTKEIMTAFTKGINAYIDHIGENLPVEFRLLKIQPKKWQPEDCLGRMSGIIMSRNFQTEIARSELVAEVGIEKARRLAPTDPIRDYAPTPQLGLAGIDQKILAGYTAALKPLDFKGDDGSNNWVVDGKLSVSGKPMLASDPHRAINLPSLRYLVHLNAPGWNVIGSGEPALPGVAIGHNEHVAWGFTIVGTDQADIYVEETHPDDPMQYRVGGKWEKMTTANEGIAIKGQEGTFYPALRFTRHGPVLYQDEARRRAYVLKWVGLDAGGAAYLGSLALDRAKHGKDFVQRLQAWRAPSENMVYADTDGNIGWVASGTTPVRKGWDGLFPVPGAGSAFEWQRFLSVEEWPQVHNPKGHFIATANHNILSLPEGTYKHEIAYEWATPYRNRRIVDRLSEKRAFTLDDFRKLQHDSISIPGQTLVKLLKKVEIQERELQPFVELLKAWDGELSPNSQAGPLYGIWLRELLHGLFRMHVPESRLEFLTGRSGIPVLLNALENPDEFWFGSQPEEGRARLIRTSFRSAVKKTQELLGNDPGQWRWGKLHSTTFHHPLAHLGDVHAGAFSLGPIPRAGDGNTPNAAGHNSKFEHISGATYRHIFDLSDWDRGLATSAPGQSGQPGSPHYADLLPLWANGDYFPLVFSRKKVEEVTKHRLVLLPK